MLVLSRQRDEAIMIGDDIVVTVVDIRGDKVRLGIDAPLEVPVHRLEVYESIHRNERRGILGVDPSASNIVVKELGESPADSQAAKAAKKAAPQRELKGGLD